jgi:hypothetical protein
MPPVYLREPVDVEGGKTRAFGNHSGHYLPDPEQAAAERKTSLQTVAR